MIWKKPFPAPPHHLVFHIEAEEEEKKELERKKKKPCLCKLPRLSRFLIIFLETRLVRLLRPHFLFVSSSLWFRSRQFGDVFSDANSPTDIPQSPCMINGAYSEVKISREPILKWKLISTTTHTAVSQASPFCHFLRLSHSSNSLPERANHKENTVRSRNESRGASYTLYPQHL